MAATSLRTLTLVDASLAGLSGTGQILLSQWAAPRFGIARSLLVLMGVVSVCYCAYGIWIRRSGRLTSTFVRALVSANAAYGVCVLVLIAALVGNLTTLGTAYLIFECLVVATLTWWESRVLQAHQRR